MNAFIAEKIYEKMFLIRKCEETIAEYYNEGKMRCPTHLSIGQEAVPAALGAAVSFDDLAVSTHRCHAHYLGKGGSIKAMIAEIYGKVTGCCRGRGGSMHLIDEDVGFMGSTAIVANSIPVGVGLGLSLQLKKSPNVSIVFLGDGAVEEGAFYEAANFAALKKIPVLFFCENNLYSVYSPLRVRQPEGRKISELASSIGLNSSSGDGNNAEFCFETIKSAREMALAGNGPQFLEFFTYRWLEHCGPHLDNHLGYRSEEEFLRWKNLDPIQSFKTNLLSNNLSTKQKLLEIENRILFEIKDAFIFAENSPFADDMEAFGPIFKSKFDNLRRSFSNDDEHNIH